MRRVLFAVVVCFVAPDASAADDWVDDDQVNGFYKKGIIRTHNDYDTQPQDMQPGDMDQSGDGQDPNGGAINQSFSRPTLPRGDLSNQGGCRALPPDLHIGNSRRNLFAPFITSGSGMTVAMTPRPRRRGRRW